MWFLTQFILLSAILIHNAHGNYSSYAQGSRSRGYGRKDNAIRPENGNRGISNGPVHFTGTGRGSTSSPPGSRTETFVPRKIDPGSHRPTKGGKQRYGAGSTNDNNPVGQRDENGDLKYTFGHEFKGKPDYKKFGGREKDEDKSEAKWVNIYDVNNPGSDNSQRGVGTHLHGYVGNQRFYGNQADHANSGETYPGRHESKTTVNDEKTNSDNVESTYRNRGVKGKYTPQKSSSKNHNGRRNQNDYKTEATGRANYHETKNGGPYVQKPNGNLGTQRHSDRTNLGGSGYYGTRSQPNIHIHGNAFHYETNPAENKSPKDDGTRGNTRLRQGKDAVRTYFKPKEEDLDNPRSDGIRQSNHREELAEESARNGDGPNNERSDLPYHRGFNWNYGSFKGKDYADDNKDYASSSHGHRGESAPKYHNREDHGDDERTEDRREGTYIPDRASSGWKHGHHDDRDHDSGSNAHTHKHHPHEAETTRDRPDTHHEPRGRPNNKFNDGRKSQEHYHHGHDRFHPSTRGNDEHDKVKHKENDRGPAKFHSDTSPKYHHVHDHGSTKNYENEPRRDNHKHSSAATFGESSRRNGAQNQYSQYTEEPKRPVGSKHNYNRAHHNDETRSKGHPDEHSGRGSHHEHNRQPNSNPHYGGHAPYSTQSPRNGNAHFGKDGSRTHEGKYNHPSTYANSGSINHENNQFRNEASKNHDTSRNRHEDGGIHGYFDHGDKSSEHHGDRRGDGSGSQNHYRNSNRGSSYVHSEGRKGPGDSHTHGKDTSDHYAIKKGPRDFENGEESSGKYIKEGSPRRSGYHEHHRGNDHGHKEEDTDEPHHRYRPPYYESESRDGGTYHDERRNADTSHNDREGEGDTDKKKGNIGYRVREYSGGGPNGSETTSTGTKFNWKHTSLGPSHFEGRPRWLDWTPWQQTVVK